MGPIFSTCHEFTWMYRTLVDVEEVGQVVVPIYRYVDLPQLFHATNYLNLFAYTD